MIYFEQQIVIMNKKSPVAAAEDFSVSLRQFYANFIQTTYSIALFIFCIKPYAMPFLFRWPHHLSPALQVRTAVVPVACWPQAARPECSRAAASSPGHAGMSKRGIAGRSSSPWQSTCVINEWVQLLKGALPAASVTTCHPAPSHLAW